MSQQWTFKDDHQAQQEFIKKERILTTGILVLIDETIHYFADKKAWESQQAEILKGDFGNYAWTNLTPWHEWLRERDKNKL